MNVHNIGLQGDSVGMSANINDTETTVNHNSNMIDKGDGTID